MMALTDAACRNAKPTEKDRKLTDGGSLYLLVKSNGSKVWRMNYSFDSKQKTFTIGKYPLFSLAAARLRRDDAKRLLADGVDPSAAKRDRTMADHTMSEPVTPQNSFESVAREWLANQSEVWVPDHVLRVQGRLERDAFVPLGKMAVDEILPTDVLAAVRAVEERGAIDVAKRLRQTISAIMRFAIAKGLATVDPAASIGAALKPKPKVKHMASLKASEIGTFLEKLREYDGEESTRLAVEFVLHTFVRTNELRFGTWSEIDCDLWRIPAERMKMERDHIVPLTRQSLAILERLRELAGNSPWIVPGDKPSKPIPISQNTMIFALYRLGYRSKLTIHGFRGTASTVLNESGLFQKDWIEMQLSHSDEDAIRSAYNAAEYLPQRRQMMAWWSDYLDSTVERIPEIA